MCVWCYSCCLNTGDIGVVPGYNGTIVNQLLRSFQIEAMTSEQASPGNGNRTPAMKAQFNWYSLFWWLFLVVIGDISDVPGDERRLSNAGRAQDNETVAVLVNAGSQQVLGRHTRLYRTFVLHFPSIPITFSDIQHFFFFFKKLKVHTKKIPPGFYF